MTDTEVVKELRRAKAALSALSGLPDEYIVSAHADSICARLGWAAKLVSQLDAEDVVLPRQEPGIRGGMMVGSVDENTREAVLKYMPERTDSIPAWASRAVPLVMLSNGTLLLDTDGQFAAMRRNESRNEADQDR